MNYDLFVLASKLRRVENLEQLRDVKEFAESLMNREKNYAVLTLMAVAEELGEEELVETLDRLRTHMDNMLKK